MLACVCGEPVGVCAGVGSRCSGRVRLATKLTLRFHDGLCTARAHTHTHTGLSDVVVETSTCADTQYLDVKNNRMSSEKYKGYSCAIEMLIPQPIRSSLIPVCSPSRLHLFAIQYSSMLAMCCRLGPAMVLKYPSSHTLCRCDCPLAGKGGGGLVSSEGRYVGN